MEEHCLSQQLKTYLFSKESPEELVLPSLSRNNKYNKDQDDNCWLTTSTDDRYFDRFWFFPNTTHSEIIIEIDYPVSNVEFFNPDGRILKIISTDRLINIANFQSGIYYMKIYTDQGIGINPNYSPL